MHSYPDFFNKYIVGLLYLKLLHSEIQLPADQNFHPWLVESADVKCVDMEGLLYYATLYKGLEHPWISISLRDTGTNPPWIPRDNDIRTVCHNLGVKFCINYSESFFINHCN